MTPDQCVIAYIDGDMQWQVLVDALIEILGLEDGEVTFLRSLYMDHYSRDVRYKYITDRLAAWPLARRIKYYNLLKGTNDVDLPEVLRTR